MAAMLSLLKYFFLLLSCVMLVSAIPAYYDDLNTAADEHHLGRVQIKVYRGPTEHDGHEHFAPWGFWVKQPADHHHHH